MSYATSQRPPVPIQPGKHHFSLNERGDREIWYSFSACDSEIYPFDRAVVAAIREFFPEFVPVVVRTAYRTPNGVIYAEEFQALGHMTFDPRKKPRAEDSERILWPCSPGAVNYGMERHGRWWVQDDALNAMPYWQRHLGWWVVPKAQGSYWQWKRDEESDRRRQAERECKARRDAKAEREARAREAGFAEIDYRIDHDAGHIGAAFGSMSDIEIREMSTDDLTPEPKPFVH